MISHHVFVGERLMAFSDAVFSIVATIMVSYNFSVCGRSHSSLSSLGDTFEIRRKQNKWSKIMLPLYAVIHHIII